jgi:hypothetical protein
MKKSNPRKQVLLVTRTDDNDSVDRVAAALERRGARGVRLDTDAFPTEVRLANAQHGAKLTRIVDTGSERVDLEALHALWYRRFNAGALLPDSLGDTLQPSIDESRRTLLGTLGATTCFQLDRWSRVRDADHKELQLRRAANAGLAVPRTLVTNDPAAAKTFFRQLKGRVLFKMQHSFAVMRDGLEHVVYTNPLTEADLDTLGGLQFCPMTFQEAVPKKLELRATVVGQKVFTAAIDSQASNDGLNDWRRDGVALLESWIPWSLPRKVEQQLLKVVSAFGLNYAAADLILTPKGEYVFLEINAGGEFFWLERVPGLPISEALADTLLTPSRRLKPTR